MNRLSTNVFSYGSNMLSRRLVTRVASARPVTIGYVTGRRIAFHKCGTDGSAKADAMFTGVEADVLWGVIFSLDRDDMQRLDTFERGYNGMQVNAFGHDGVIQANIYVAREEMIDPSLKPYCWYHRYVVDGAIEHRLPRCYIEQLRSFPFIADQDRQRRHRNSHFD